MAFRQDTDLRTAMADEFAAHFPASSTLTIYTGTQPATADTAASGSVLATITLPASPWAAASAGAVSKQNTWSATASGTGTAGYARLVNGTKAVDLAIPGELTISDSSIVTGGTVTVTSLTYTVPTGN